MVKIKKQPPAPSPTIPRGKAFKIEKKKKNSTKLVKEVVLRDTLSNKVKPKKQHQTNGNSSEAEDAKAKLSKLSVKEVSSRSNIIEAKVKKPQQVDETTSEVNGSTVKPKKQQQTKSKTKKLKESTVEPNTQHQQRIAADADEDVKPTVLRKDIKSAVLGVLKLRKNNPKFRKQLVDDPFLLSLQISCHRVPVGNPTLLRVPLRHSPYCRDAEVCVIVPDIKGIPVREHERHLEHYEELFRTKGVEGIKKIMTLNELKTEHETFEQKSRLANLYDVFLSDGRIAGKVVKHCGKAFYRRHKVAVPVKLHVSKLKEHLEKQLRKSTLHLHLKGNSYSVRFGNSEMGVDKLVDNVESVVEFLGDSFPGGMGNVSGIHAYTFRTTTIPIYLSGKSPNEVPTPIIPEKLPKAYKTHRGELTTFPDMDVEVKPTGDITVIRIECDDEEGRRKKRKRKVSAGRGDKKGKETVVRKKRKKGDAVENGKPGPSADQAEGKKKKKRKVPTGEKENVKGSKKSKRNAEDLSQEPEKKIQKLANKPKKVVKKKAENFGKYVVAPK